ncbi:MAG: SPASM domain-containing protein [Deltaproteobacteria bacterium]|nr:SPASM domain-containing protein [Deltaproteobacteria bacterium]
MTGTDQKNDKIRRRTSLEQILQAIEILRELKRESNTPRPEIHIAYMLLRSGLEDGRARPYIPLNFGSVNEESLSQIWWKRAYKSFRRSFSSGKFAQPCAACSKRQIFTGETSTAPSLRLLMDLPC